MSERNQTASAGFAVALAGVAMIAWVVSTGEATLPSFAVAGLGLGIIWMAFSATTAMASAEAVKAQRATWERTRSELLRIDRVRLLRAAFGVTVVSGKDEDASVNQQMVRYEAELKGHRERNSGGTWNSRHLSDLRYCAERLALDSASDARQLDAAIEWVGPLEIRLSTVTGVQDASSRLAAAQ